MARIKESVILLMLSWSSLFLQFFFSFFFFFVAVELMYNCLHNLFRLSGSKCLMCLTVKCIVKRSCKKLLFFKKKLVWKSPVYNLLHRLHNLKPLVKCTVESEPPTFLHIKMTKCLQWGRHSVFLSPTTSSGLKLPTLGETQSFLPFRLNGKEEQTKKRTFHDFHFKVRSIRKMVTAFALKGFFFCPLG